MAIRKKPFQLLDETATKISDLREVVCWDHVYSAYPNTNYCGSSWAFTGTINYRKAFPKSLEHRSFLSQKGHIAFRFKRFCKSKPCTILLFWETGAKLRLHTHGVIFGLPSVVDKVNKYWKRVIGHTLLKPIDNPDKWFEYIQKELYRNEIQPTYISGAS